LNFAYPGLTKVINNGQEGVCSKWGLEHLEDRVIQKNPDTVIMEFAANDAYPPLKVSINTAKSNLIKMIDRIQEAHPDCEIILMNMNPMYGPPLQRRPNLKSYYQIYHDVAESRKLIFIDHYHNWEEVLHKNPAIFKKWIPDGAHPNSGGCRNVILPTTLQVLGFKIKNE